MATKPTTYISVSNGTILRVGLWGILFYLLYYLRDIFLILLTSIVIASFVEATANRLARIRLNRTFAVVLIYILIVLLFAGLFYVFAPIIITEVASLTPMVQKYFPTAEIPTFLTGKNLTQAEKIITSLSQSGSIGDVVNGAQAIASKISGGIFGILAALFGGIINLVLVTVISFYLSIQENGIEKFLRIIVPQKNEDYIVGLWKRTQRKIALWIKGQLLLGLIIGIVTFIGLTLLDVPYALILAIFAAIFELIPFGIVLAAIPAISFGYMQGGFVLALIVAGFYTIVQQLENYFLQPLVIKKVIGISPLVVLLSVLMGAALAGFWGLILAIPVAVSILEYMGDIEKKKAGVPLTD
jgi:predicted PurR-regulated permease PerM